MASEPKTEAKESTEEAAPRKKRGKLILVLVLLVVLGGGGGAGWFFMKPADATAEAAPPKPKPAIFLPLETFTVNLVSPDGQPQFAQTGITLKLDEAGSQDKIKERMPEVRDRVLMVLSTRRASDLLPITGKQKLAADISDAVKSVITPPPVAKKAAKDSKDAKDAVKDVAAADAKDGKETAPAGPLVEVLFTSFIIQ